MTRMASGRPRCWLVVAFEDEGCQGVEAAAGFGLYGGARKGVHGAGAIIFGESLGEITAVPALEHVEDAVDVVVFDFGFGVDGAQDVAVGAEDLLQGLDDGQGLLLVRDVGADGLAGGTAFAPDAEDVVADLEGEADLAAEGFEARAFLVVGAGDEGSEMERGAEEGGALV